MKNSLNKKLEAITPGTLVVGVDVAKSLHWARFVDYRGQEIGKAMSFKNNRQGIDNILASIGEISKLRTLRHPIEKVIIGMEPTGHYWKALTNQLLNKGYIVVGVNPYHTKKAKELDDNSQTKNDRKDAITIARLVKDGRYFEVYLPREVYGELRVLTNERMNVNKRLNAVKNTITAILDEYFPEINTVFKKPLDGKASRQILRGCPFPLIIIAMGEVEILAEIRKAVKKTVGIKKVRQSINAAKSSIGVTYGLQSAQRRLRRLVDEMTMLDEHLTQIEQEMDTRLRETGYAEQLLSIKGIGIVSAASFLGEIGDPLRFQSARQIARLAGYNLIEDSSGKSKSGTSISKRGRKQLRSILYRMALIMVSKNDEMKVFYKHLTNRGTNPLRRKQALVVVSKKIITIIFSMVKKREEYKPELVFGAVRKEMLEAA